MILFAWPWFLLSLLALFLYVVLFFRRPRRKKQPVSQVFLFMRAKRDVLTRFTRWRTFRNLLFFVELFFLLLLSLSSAVPETALGSFPGRHCILALDTSLSMMAEDLTPTRFERAKREAGELLHQLLAANDLISLWTFGSSPQMLNDFTDREKNLLAALEGITPSFSPVSDLESLLVSLEEKAGDSTLSVYIFSDFAMEALPGKFPHLVLYPIYVGGAIENAGILSAKLEGDLLWIKIGNFSHSARELHLTVEKDEEPIGEKTVVAEAMDLVDLEFPLTFTPSLLRITLKDRDSFLWDNSYLITSLRAPRVLLVSSSPFLRVALEALGVNVVEILPIDYRPEIRADLLVTENFVPSQWPNYPALVIHPPSGNDIFPWTGTATSGFSYALEDPLLRFVNLEPLSFYEVPSFLYPPSLEPIAFWNQTPLILRGEMAGQRAVVFAPSLSLSNFPLDPSFPIFLSNALNWLSEGLETKAELISPLLSSWTGRGSPPGIYGQERSDGWSISARMSSSFEESDLLRSLDPRPYGTIWEVRDHPLDLTRFFLLTAFFLFIIDEILRGRHEV